MSDLSSNETILHARITACCRPHYEIFFSALLAIVFVIFLSMPKAELWLVSAWAIISVAILLTRFLFILYFNRLPQEKITRTHGTSFTVIMLIWGCCWGVATLLFFSALTTLEQAAWFAMFMVMIAASASSHAIYLRAFYAFALPYFAGILYEVAVNYPSTYHVNAVILFLVMVTQVGAAKKAKKVMLESLTLRFENIALIEQLREQKEQAETANLAKSKFLAAASHDLRQPLHALTLFSASLEQAANNQEKTLDIANQISNSVDALQSLFNALLDISRLDAGTLENQPCHFDVTDLLSKLEQEFSSIAQTKALTLELPQSPCIVLCDQTLTELMLRNLLSNAIRYTEKGSIKVQLNKKCNNVWVEIIDTGIGIDESDQLQIFDEFVQLSNPERDRTKGLGLGLSIVKRVAKLLDSTITLTSTKQQGSTFAFTLPIGDKNLVQQQPPPIQSLNNKNLPYVVVIDDEETILMAMETLLTGWHYQTVCARSSAEAQRAISNFQEPPSCIIADYRLQENKSGIEAIADIRSHFQKNIPALMVSGDIAKERIEEVKQAGLAMLHKPIAPAKLRAFLNNL